MILYKFTFSKRAREKKTREYVLFFGYKLVSSEFIRLCRFVIHTASQFPLSSSRRLNENWFRLQRRRTRTVFVCCLSLATIVLFNWNVKALLCCWDWEMSAHDSNVYFVTNVRFWWFHLCCLLCNHEIIFVVLMSDRLLSRTKLHT